MRPNILYLSLDAFRHDRCFGKIKTSKTPGIDSLIKKGIWFNQAITCSDSTPISFASTFTGVYPFESSITKGVSYEMNYNLKDYLTILRENGYHSYATIPNPYFISAFTKLFENQDMLYSIFEDRLYNGLGEKIIKKLASKSLVEPWIYFVHLMDTHKPIHYPVDFDGEEYGKDDYDRLISSVDTWITKFLQSINLENTIVVLTSDHGDYLGIIERKGKRISFEYKSLAKPFLNVSKTLHKLPRPIRIFRIKVALILKNIMTIIRLKKMGIKLSHYEKRAIMKTRSNQDRFLFDELFRVPLILSGYKIPQNLIINQQVRNVDIFPTLLDLIGISSLNNSIHGTIMSPLLKGEKMEEEPAYMESGVFLADKPYAAMGIRTPKYKYFRGVHSSNKIHLYDLTNDPLEQINIAREKPDVVNQMEKILMGIRKKTAIIQEEKLKEDEDKEVEEELRKLGYI